MAQDASFKSFEDTVAMTKREISPCTDGFGVPTTWRSHGVLGLFLEMLLKWDNCLECL